MKTLFMLFLINIFTLAFTSHASEKTPKIDNYRLSIDDQISINVFNEPDLSVTEVRVSTDGTISIPLIGNITANALTITELKNNIVEKLLDGYLKKPHVTITITEYRPFYINGEVKKAGSYPYRKNLTVEKAVTLAGGFTERASRQSVTLVSEKDKTHVQSVNLSAVIKPGDIITVSESFF